MGKIAKKYCSFSIVTADNSRGENLSEIISDIMWQYTDYGVTICDRNDIIALQTAKETTYWDYMDDELEEGLISEEYYWQINTKMKAKYRPISDGLISENELICALKRA